MFEWAAELGLEITREAVDLAFLPTVPNVETRCAALGIRAAADAYSTDSLKDPLEAWRRLQTRYDPRTGGRKRKLLRTIIPLGLFSNVTRVSSVSVSHYE